MSDFLERLFKIAGTNNQSEIARKLGVPNTTLSNWVSRGVSKGGALKISQTYGVNIDYVLTGQGEMITPASQSQKLDYEPSTSTIEFMDTLKEMEKSGELTPQVIGLLNNTLNTVKSLSGQRLSVSHLVEVPE